MNGKKTCEERSDETEIISEVFLEIYKISKG